MSDFFKKFLTEDPRKLSPSGRFVGLAAFGKHPGWDDHVEDLGLETESLSLAKKVLYVNGIGGQIDAGAWEKLDAGRQLPAFKHLFVWQRGGQFLIGRMWSSSDGKGRKSYPMVVCVHCAGVPLGVALKQVLPALEELQRQCMAAKTAEEVRTLLNRTRAALRESPTATESRAEYAPVSPEQLSKILQAPAAAGNAEAFPRVLYQLHSQMSSFAPGKFNPKTAPASLRPQQLRVGTTGGTPEQEFLFWTRFLQTQIDPALPLLLALPLDEGWMDVLVGEPESAQFFCLRASPKAVSLVSEVPYTLDDAFRAHASKFLAAFQRGETGPADLPVISTPVVADAPSAKKGGWLRWFAVAVLGLGIAGGTVIFLREPPKQTAKASPSGKKPEVTPPPVTNASARTTAAIPPAVPVKAPIVTEADAAALAAEKKNSETMAAAARLKADAEAAAAKEKERQVAEAKRLEAEKEAQQRAELARAEAARKKAEAEAKAQLAAAAEAAKNAVEVKPSSPAVSATPEMTNSIGMILVRLPSGLQVGKYEVTQAEYQQIMGTNPSKSVGERKPVERVTWNDAKEFCRKLTERERGKLPEGAAYNLPSEKQWTEFAALNPEDAPVLKEGPVAVGTTGSGNKFGLFDVVGNVSEWILDDAPSNQKRHKGGAFNSKYLGGTMLPEQSRNAVGFRCVLAAP